MFVSVYSCVCACVCVCVGACVCVWGRVCQATFSLEKKLLTTLPYSH